MNQKKLPELIQGGMGIGISSVRLARLVSKTGHLGVISGTALAPTLVKRLQKQKGNKRYLEAVKAFPFPKMAKRILRLYLPKPDGQGIKQPPMPSLNQPDHLTELIVLANFCEVYLAKKGHKGVIGINLLEKIQLPTLPSIYGAMLAGVDYVLMGAGIPKYIPEVLDQFSQHKTAMMPIKVVGNQVEPVHYQFDPKTFIKDETLVSLSRPKFLAIISSTTLALHLTRDKSHQPDGFIVELPIAGGHNAPPRGQLQLNESGEPIYGVKDNVDLNKLKQIGLPYWLAGGYGSHKAYLEAKASGATGIQVGTAFAFCRESGMLNTLKTKVIASLKAGTAKVKTDLLASPTGFPFKVVNLVKTIGEKKTYDERKRICDIGYLREIYQKPNGDIAYRCPSEPIEAFVKKGGSIDETKGRACLCNGLMAGIGYGNKRKPTNESPIITAGDDLLYLLDFLKPGEKLYSALDVIKQILNKQPLKLN